MNLSKNKIEKIIVYLIENNYLNESRFAKVFTGGKFRIKNWGKIRIIRELKYRKISNYNIIVRFLIARLFYNDGLVTIFALGGISEKNIHKLKLLSIKGIGGIRLFKKKPAFKRPVFIKNNFF